MLRWRRINRKVHYWVAVITATPLLAIIGSGVLLQIKKQCEWVQPATICSIGGTPEITFGRMLEIARSVPEVRVLEWEDIDRLDTRPGKGIIKIRCKNHGKYR
jgi:hypothetical protein